MITNTRKERPLLEDEKRLSAAAFPTFTQIVNVYYDDERQEVKDYSWRQQSPSPLLLVGVDVVLEDKLLLQILCLAGCQRAKEDPCPQEGVAGRGCKQGEAAEEADGCAARPPTERSRQAEEEGCAKSGKGHLGSKATPESAPLGSSWLFSLPARWRAMLPSPKTQQSHPSRAEIRQKVFGGPM